MKPSNLLKNLFISSLIISSLSGHLLAKSIHLSKEDSAKITSTSALDLLEGKIDTKSLLYKNIENDYANLVTSELTRSQSFESTPDDDLDTHSNPDRLNQTQLWAIFGYTTGNFMSINKALRSKSPRSKLMNQPELLNQIIVIRAALQKIKSFKGKVYRGAHLSASALKNHTPGSIVNYPGFLSTSTSRDASENFVQNALLVIHGKNGKSVRSYSQVPQEDEILFDHNSKFRVLKRTQTKIEFIENPIVEEIELEEI